MPCPLPGNKAVLSEEAEFRDSERQKVIDRAAKLHKEGLSNAVIMQRLGITRPTLVDYLRAAGLSGASAKPSAETAESGGAVPAVPRNVGVLGDGFASRAFHGVASRYYGRFD